MEQNEKYAELIRYYAEKIERLTDPLTAEEKQLIARLGRSILKRQVPKRVKYKRRQRENGMER